MTLCTEKMACVFDMMTYEHHERQKYNEMVLRMKYQQLVNDRVPDS